MDSSPCAPAGEPVPAPALQGAFEQGTRRVTEAMKHLRMEILDETHWKRFDSAERLFWNMNTPADYDEAKRILEAETGVNDFRDTDYDDKEREKEMRAEELRSDLEHEEGTAR